MIDTSSGNARPVDGLDVATHPTVIAGRYELGGLLGRGASAVVRRALDRVSGRTFAIKLFHAGASASDRRRQQREMRALAALHHPGLVALHDGGVEADRPYIVTDLVEGPSLAERIAERPLDAAQVRRLGAHLADALAHVHVNGIVHRDLKPANVLMGADGRPRLADFGIARAVDGTAVTGTGYVIGTAAYLAPEQVRGEWVGPEADVYALGLVLLESLTGRREYPGALVESATARLYRAPGIPEDLPSTLRTVLHAMTALEPAARPTAAQVAALLSTGSTRHDRDRPRGFGRGLHRRRRDDDAALAGVTAGSVGGSAAPPSGRHAPGVIGLVAVLAAAASITAAALPSRAPASSGAAASGVAGPGAPPSGAASPTRVGGQGAAVSTATGSTVPTAPAAGAVGAPATGALLASVLPSTAPVDRLRETLGEGVDAARRAALARSLTVGARPTDGPRVSPPARPRTVDVPTGSDRSSSDDDRPGRHRAPDDD